VLRRHCPVAVGEETAGEGGGYLHAEDPTRELHSFGEDGNGIELTN
jgi:hypothetical protein